MLIIFEEITPAMAITAASHSVFKNQLEGVYTASLPIADIVDLFCFICTNLGYFDDAINICNNYLL